MLRNFLKRMKGRVVQVHDNAGKSRWMSEGEAIARSIEERRTKYQDYPSPYRTEFGPPENHPWAGRWFV